MFLFASLPSGFLPQLTTLRRLECQKLCREFAHYVAHMSVLTKGFLSVKGVYYQARLRGKHDVTWVVHLGARAQARKDAVRAV